MNQDKHLIVHFNNGGKMEVSFPTQIKNSTAALVEGLKTILQADKLVVQADRGLIIVPWASVKYVEASAVADAALPFGAIKGARIVESTDGTSA